ncbi:MAG TPA: XRE family transcriptional regulator [Streptosporangiaceae bacterium]
MNFERERVRAARDVTVGERLRAVRRARKLTLLAVAKRAEISEGYLSQVERGIANPSIGTLQQIAEALGLKIGDLFASDFDARPRVLRVDARPGLAFGVLGRKYRLTAKAQQHIEAFVGEFDPGGATGEDGYTHGDSEELLLVLAGRVELTLDGEPHVMDVGDSIVYRSSTPHRLAEVGGAPATVLWVISPPSY